MDPWYEILNRTSPTHEEANVELPEPLLDIAQFLHQMGVLDSFDSYRLAPPAAKEAVESLKRTVISSDTDVKCPICLRELEEGDTQVSMPCNHIFHDQCILAWLGKTNSCPVCRFELRTDDPEYEQYREKKMQEKKRRENVRILHNSMYS